jgi:hypothetical protein
MVVELLEAKTTATTKYRDSSPFDFAQGQNDDDVGYAVI